MPVGPFFADFLCRECNFIIELDGHSHDLAPQNDIYRDSYLNKAGYRVMHFQNSEVLSNVAGVIMAIGVALKNAPTPDPSRKREGGQ